MTHYSEEELIAFHLEETAHADEIARHLETCIMCASLADSIGETLRVFSGGPVPQANLDRSWQRLRVNLPLLPTQKRPWSRVFGRRAGLVLWLAPALAILLVVATGLLHRRNIHPSYANNRLGPLTMEPNTAISLPSVNTHIDSAERLLTEVNHTSGPLNAAAQQQAHTLLLSNAEYLRQANVSGDLAQALLLEHLGRVLTTLDHEKDDRGSGWHMRFEVNTDGLLLDLRVLQQNTSSDPAKETR